MRDSPADSLIPYIHCNFCLPLPFCGVLHLTLNNNLLQAISVASRHAAKVLKFVSVNLLAYEVWSPTSPLTNSFVFYPLQEICNILRQYLIIMFEQVYCNQFHVTVFIRLWTTVLILAQYECILIVWSGKIRNDWIKYGKLYYYII